MKKRTHTAAFKLDVALAAIKGELTQAQITGRYQLHTTQINRWKKLALEGIKNAFSEHAKQAKPDKEQERLLSELYEEIGRLKVELNWLKKNLILSVEDKKMRIEPLHPTLSIQRQCALLGLSRASYYYHHKPHTAVTETLMRLLDERYTQYPTEGACKLARWLMAKGYVVGRYKVRSLMKLMGLEPIYPKPDLSAPALNPHRIYPYVLNQMDISKPNQVWCADITYLPTHVGHVYLVAIMDWFSRYVLAWEIGTSLEVDFCLTALKHALSQACCKVFNTDQGSQFTSRAWIEVLTSHHITISMDGRGRYLDNIFVERLWRSVKYECIYLQEFYSVKEVKHALTNYFHYYNFERLHEALDYRTPYQVYSSD